jgi:ABC-type bacteriocin/lantibiotic exporter with double-glycine peptidase domain/CRP-like cAMP-binding protein
MTVAVLRDLPLLHGLGPDVRELVEGAFVAAEYPFGAVIVREGEEADAFYVLVSGTARAVKVGPHGEEVALNVLRPGDYFGELALLEQTSRSATVRASCAVEVLKLDRSVFGSLVRSHPGLRAQLAESVRAHRLRDFLRVHTALARVPSEALEQLIGQLEVVEVAPGEPLPPGPLHVVRDGHLRVGGGGYARSGDYFSGAAEALTRCELLRAATFDSVRAEVEERADQARYRELAHVPPDFAEEILAPAPPVEPEPEEWDGSARPRRRIRRFPQVWQIDEADCGAAALAMVCRHFGREVSLAHIRRAVGTGADGTSLAGIAHGGESVGLEARTVKASRDSLDSLPLPAVVHWDAGHWVVLYDVSEGRVRVADPARGHRRMTREEFERGWSGYAALLSPTGAFAEAPEEQPRLRWLLGFFAPYRGTLLRAFVLALVAAGLQMAIPVFSQVIVDTVLSERDYALLHVLALAMLAVLAIATLATVVQRLILSRAAVKIDGTTLDFVTGSLLDLPMSYFAARRTGDIERRLAGMRQVRILIVQNGVQGMTAATQLLVAVALMFVYSPALALVYLGSVPVYALLMRFSRTRLRPIFDSLEEAYGKYQSRQIDAIKGIETVKAMGAEPALRGMMLAQFKDLAGRVFRADLTVMAYDGAVQMTTFLSLAVFLWVGALEVLGGTLSVGQLVSFNALVLLGNAAVGVLLLLWDEVQQGSVLVGRLHDILAEEPEQGSDHSGLEPVPPLEGRVRLERVGFHHGGPIATPSLEDVTLDVPAGATVAIVGRSGAGKTTLVKCLAGLLEPTSGTIRYDGLDMRILRYRELRRQIGFVLQDTYLFDDTIAHNIALDESYPDMERVVWAARVANAHEFIERLPLGYDARVGETGVLLAGGQRQRIAIARAVYRRPPVLILDEATSSLDSESERAVQENLDRLLDGRTSFVIAHRLSTVRDADVIVVLEKGRLVDQGTHDELMARRGLYWYLVSQQLEL